MLAGGRPLGDERTVDNPTTIGDPNPEAWKFGIHFSSASSTTSGDGLVCFSKPQKNTLSGGRPSVMLNTQPWQIRATGISLIREHSFCLQSPLSLRPARQVQQPCWLHSSLRSCVVSQKKSVQSHSLCTLCPLIRQDHWDTLGP